MAPKRTQVVHVNKGNDKIVIAQSTHDAATGLTTRSKEKSTSSLLTKQTSESACLLKLIRKHDEHQPLITLVSLVAKSRSPRVRENSLQHYRILGINLLSLLPMLTLAPVHALDRQLECQKWKTIPIVPTLLILPSQ